MTKSHLVISTLLALGCGFGGGLDPGPPDGTGIKGTLIFNGAWPPETADVAVAVYQRRPQSLADFFSIAGWDTTVALGVTRFEYFVPLESPGSYEWVVVAWRPQGGFWNFSSLLGCYHVGNDTLPTPVQVTIGETVKNVDIQNYFDLVQGVDRPDREICTGFLPLLPAGLKPVGFGRNDLRPGNRR
jgi:hypothetical protein